MKILVCSDGERHSKNAIKKAISLGSSLSADVTALHVVDPWLKTFYNEIYSQGRQQYLEYVDQCLKEQAEQVRRGFDKECIAKGFHATFKLRHGEPLAEILKEVSQFCPQLLITGGKYLTGWKKFKSKNLPLHLTNKIGEVTKVMVVGGGP